MSNHIKCTLPNAADVINGVKFEVRGAARYAISVADDVAAHFQDIPGFELVAKEDIPKLKADAEQTATDAEKTVADGVKAIEEMTVAEIGKLLSEHPSAWQDVLDAENKRDKPRDGVLKAADEAKSKAQDDGAGAAQ